MNFSRKTQREIFLILVFLSAAPLVYLNFFGAGGVLRVKAHRGELGAIRQENEALRRDVLKLQEQIDRIKSDPKEVERIGREEYNLAKPGDIIINIPQAPQAPQTPLDR